MTRGQGLRLIWIDAFVEEKQFVMRRAHIELAFDISTPQASLDLRLFMRLFPGRLVYDKSEKGYRADAAVQSPFTADERAAALLAGAAAARAHARIDAAMEGKDENGH